MARAAPDASVARMMGGAFRYVSDAIMLQLMSGAWESCGTAGTWDADGLSWMAGGRPPCASRRHGLQSHGG